MINRVEFLTNFVDRFYLKNSRLRRSSKNQAYYLSTTINLICRKLFDRKIKFEDEEIFKAFNAAGFILMESGQEEFTWERFQDGHILILCDLFINVKVQSNHDLRLATKRSYPPNFKEETIQRIDNLKIGLQKFWEVNNVFLNLD